MFSPPPPKKNYFPCSVLKLWGALIHWDHNGRYKQLHHHPLAADSLTHTGGFWGGGGGYGAATHPEIFFGNLYIFVQTYATVFLTEIFCLRRNFKITFAVSIQNQNLRLKVFFLPTNFKMTEKGRIWLPIRWTINVFGTALKITAPRYNL